MPSEPTSPDAAPTFDFGAFSFHSFGVTLTVPEEVGRRYPNAAASALLMFQWSGEERVRSLRELYAADADPGARFALVGYASALPHELRHYHDHLATPYGASQMVDHLLAARYSQPALAVLAREPTLGLPLQRWDALSPALHAAYRRRTRSGAFSPAPPPALRRLTDSAQSILARTEARLGSSPTRAEADLTTRHLLEASALTAQMEYVELLFGYDAAVAFARYTADLPGAGVYSRLIAVCNATAEALAPGRRFSSTVVNALVFYALCAGGDPAAGEWAHPVDRLFAALGYLQYSREFPDDENVLAILDHVSRVFSIPTIDESLRASAEQGEQIARALRALAERDAANGLPVDRTLCDCADAWAAAHAHMVAAIRADPMSYLDPQRYLDTLTLGGWVAAPVYLAGSGPAFRADASVVTGLRAAGWTVVWGSGDLNRSATDLEEAALIASPDLTVGHPIVPRDMASYLSSVLWITSALWSSSALSMSHRVVMTRFLAMLPPEWEILLL
jgi:hypothetical protein